MKRRSHIDKGRIQTGDCTCSQWRPTRIGEQNPCALVNEQEGKDPEYQTLQSNCIDRCDGPAAETGHFHWQHDTPTIVPTLTPNEVRIEAKHLWPIRSVECCKNRGRQQIVQRRMVEHYDRWRSSVCGLRWQPPIIGNVPRIVIVVCFIDPFAGRDRRYVPSSECNKTNDKERKCDLRSDHMWMCH